MVIALGIAYRVIMSVLTKLFTPSGKKFYDLFEQVTFNLERLSVTFEESLGIDDRYKRKSILDKIESLEQKNDDSTHKLFVELGRNYITPFDREDIHFLASSLDDIADYTWGTAKQMYYFDVDNSSGWTLKVAQALRQYIAKLSEAIKGLRNQRDLKAMIDILSDMRATTSSVDTLITDAQFELLKKNENAVEMIKLHDHYDMLQNLNNKCSDVINVLEGMVIKYG